MFPIYGPEILKFAFLSAIKFFVVWVLTLTRDTKDTLMVTQAGAESIAFLKVYAVLPAATIYITAYNAMSSKLANNKRLLFYVTCVPFFFFFVLFDTVIYPNRELLQPSLTTLESFFGNGLESSVVAKASL